MQVIKRNGKREEVSFDKITARIKKLVYGLSDHVNPIKISMRVIEGLTMVSAPLTSITLQRKHAPR